MSQMQLYRTGYDIATAMDYGGYFERFNETEMTNFTNATVPSNMRMRIQLVVYNSSESTINIGPTVATNNSVIYGDRITTVRNEPAVARFAIWQ